MTCRRSLVAVVLLIASCAASLQSEIVYTRLNVSVPIDGSFQIDLDRNGVVDFTVTSHLIQAYCQTGDEYEWNLRVTADGVNAVVANTARVGGVYASALPAGIPVNANSRFAGGQSTFAEMLWGSCGSGSLGEWLNTPDRYLGVQFRASDNTTHYGWVKLNTSAYVDGSGNLHCSTVISGIAYQTIPEEQILTGDMIGTH